MNELDVKFAFDADQLHNVVELLRGPEPTTQRERDLFNLKYLLYSVEYDSYEYRNGFMVTLQRCIDYLEGENL